ncbi:MAG: sulfatase [Candidatus Hydrogenedentes bacterium]|jgi:arylsulfatase A-like enzyme|nr:sulfatase [Candidatus Hydrogenedentota bacterium]
MFTRRSFMKYSGAAAAAVALGEWSQRCDASEKPNIIWICSDDHAQNAISAYGRRFTEVSPTPNIDRIAKEGAIFRNSFVTNSICGPSRAVVLTGLHSHLNGFLDNSSRFDGSQETFPKLLRAGGYQTALFGKWHLHTDPQGFDSWAVLPGQGDYYNPDFLLPEGKEKIEGYVTDIVTDKALRWLEVDRNQDQPFMMMIQHNAPHRPWMAGPDHLSTYEDVTFPEPDTLFDDYATRGTAAHDQDMTIEKTMRRGSDLKLLREDDRGSNEWEEIYGRMTPQQQAAWDAVYKKRVEEYEALNPQGKDAVRFKYQCYIRDYMRCIASIDDNVGRVLDYLDASGLADNTVIFYTSDQSFYLGEHGWFDKRFIYEESLRTPLLVRWPKAITPGTEIMPLVQNLDMAETMLDIAGLPIPESMQGLSVLPLMRGEKTDRWRNAIYYHYYEGETKVHHVYKHYGIRTDRYKLAYFYTLDEWEFYDLLKDPKELRNAYDNPDYADEINALKQELTRLRDVYLVPEDL